jgi:hypothetical protein
MRVYEVDGTRNTNVKGGKVEHETVVGKSEIRGLLGELRRIYKKILKRIFKDSVGMCKLDTCSLVAGFCEHCFEI